MRNQNPLSFIFYLLSFECNYFLLGAKLGIFQPVKHCISIIFSNFAS